MQTPFLASGFRTPRATSLHFTVHVNSPRFAHYLIDSTHMSRRQDVKHQIFPFTVGQVLVAFNHF